MEKSISAIDLFCGVGGLTHGLIKSGIEVEAGIDLDETCCYAYEKNNDADFICEDVSSPELLDTIYKYWKDTKKIKVLVGCAPCQPFSSHTHKVKNKENSKKWNLISSFGDLIEEFAPEIISMENVPNLSKQKIFLDFVQRLEDLEYKVSYKNVYCPNYGIPQKRRRLVLLASKFGTINLIPETHEPKQYKTTHQVIGKLPPTDTKDILEKDPMHFTTKLSDINLKRIRASKPNGSWKDWDEELRLDCHKRDSGKSYVSVYGRMSWDEPSPTITTQFYNYGTGRFGHPEQDRALTIREAALLQTFPKYYRFYKKRTDVTLRTLGMHIGNAVPVKLGKVIGQSIIQHVSDIENIST